MYRLYIFLICFLCVVGLLSSVLSVVFFFKQKTAYEMRISDWSSDVCSSDLPPQPPEQPSTTPDSGRLRIGYFSADFHNHATAYLAAGLFEQHDREIGRASCRERVCQYV